MDGERNCIGRGALHVRRAFFGGLHLSAVVGESGFRIWKESSSAVEYCEGG